MDKLNAEHVSDYMEAYLDQYASAVGPLMGKRGLRFLISDSWEAGAQNWTESMIAEFTKRRGYDPGPWLPALTGRVVESAEASDRFLWDFRRTLADMLAEHHYDQITAILKERGMGHYGESHESGRAFIGDGMEVKRTNDVPMSAMWTQRPGVNEDQPGANADIRESASVAHIYGQNLVAAESLTAGQAAWAWSPETLKPTADKELAMGLNRFVLHTSVHQPLIDKAPGPQPGAVRPVVHAQRNLGGDRRSRGCNTSRAAPSCSSRAVSSPTSRISMARIRTSPPSSSRRHRRFPTATTSTTSTPTPW